MCVLNWFETLQTKGKENVTNMQVSLFLIVVKRFVFTASCYPPLNECICRSNSVWGCTLSLMCFLKARIWPYISNHFFHGKEQFIHISNITVPHAQHLWQHYVATRDSLKWTGIHFETIKKIQLWLLQQKTRKDYSYKKCKIYILNRLG